MYMNRYDFMCLYSCISIGEDVLESESNVSFASSSSQSGELNIKVG